MKKTFLTFVFSMLSIASFAQTATELEAQLTQLQLENQSLTLQNTNFDTKIKDKEKELTTIESDLKKLQAKRSQSEEACKGISDENIHIIQGLSGGTIAIAGTGTLTGVVKATGLANKIENSASKNKNQDNNTQKLTTSSISDKVLNITATATSTGATITSAIALSKVNELKNDIQRCVESFD